MKIFLAILFLFLCFEVSGQVYRGEEPVRVTGKVVNEKTLEPIPFANMVDITRNTGTSADGNGEISFIISKGDTMQFTAIGFENLKISLNDSTPKKTYYLSVRLTPKAYMLEEVEVYANDPMAGFRRDTTHSTRYQFFSGAAGKDARNSMMGSAPVASGYITQFANLFNRHYLEEKKLSRILDQEAGEKEAQYRHDSLNMIVNTRYNKLVVGRITDLKGGELDEFIKAYKPSDIFILTASDYEFALQIVNSFSDYQQKHGLQVDLDEILRKAIFKN